MNIGWSLVAAALWGAALAALVSYWRFPENALNSRFQAFDVQGIVPVAYALFAVALGHRRRVGAATRPAEPRGHARPLRGDSASLIGVYLRPHLMAPITKLFPPVGPTSSPAGAWVLSTSFVDGRGQDLGSGIPFAEIPADCQRCHLEGARG